MDSRNCSFGQWLAQEGAERFGEDLLWPISVLHDKLHAVSKQLYVECKDQSIENRDERLAEIHKYGDYLVLLLNQLKSTSRD